MKVNKQKLKSALNILFIFGTFVLVLYFALSQEDLSTVGKTISKVNPWWLLGGLGCFLVHMSMEGGLLYVFYRFQRVKVSVRQSILCGLIGMYYSSITPAATGGQPMQVYSMKRYGVPAGITSSALAVKFFCWQCALLLMGAVAWIFNGAAIYQALGKGIWMLSLGFFLNGIMVVVVILLAISRNAVRGIIIFFVKVAHRLRLVKDVQKSSSRWDAALQDFHASVDILTKHPAQYLSLFVLSLVQVTGLMSATYFVYRGFGLSSASYAEILAVQLMLYIAASFTPLPGASGAQEGGFYLFFGNYFPGSIVFGALLVWRFLTYYLSIITGFIGVLIDGSRSRKRAARRAAEGGPGDEQPDEGDVPDVEEDSPPPPDEEAETK